VIGVACARPPAGGIEAEGFTAAWDGGQTVGLGVRGSVQRSQTAITRVGRLRPAMETAIFCVQTVREISGRIQLISEIFRHIESVNGARRYRWPL
jgi:hypothetical protein